MPFFISVVRRDQNWKWKTRMLTLESFQRGFQMPGRLWALNRKDPTKIWPWETRCLSMCVCVVCVCACACCVWPFYMLRILSYIEPVSIRALSVFKRAKILSFILSFFLFFVASLCAAKTSLWSGLFSSCHISTGRYWYVPTSAVGHAPRGVTPLTLWPSPETLQLKTQEERPRHAKKKYVRKLIVSFYCLKVVPISFVVVVDDYLDTVLFFFPFYF